MIITPILNKCLSPATELLVSFAETEELLVDFKSWSIIGVATNTNVSPLTISVYPRLATGGFSTNALFTKTINDIQSWESITEKTRLNNAKIVFSEPTEGEIIFYLC